MEGLQHTTRNMQETELIKQGWKKQATHDEPRLSEIVEMYEEIGFEIHLEPFDPESAPTCSECMAVNIENYKTVYTRKTI